MSAQALARTWRPKNFEQMIGQSHAVQALSNALNQQQLHHAYLFTGTRGVGKTTLARIIAKCLNCEQGISANPCGACNHCNEIDAGRFMDLYEVDAASRTKVEDTRELLDNVQYLPTKGRYKVYIIDEVHMLSGHSFNALLKTLEEPPAHVIFLLATTDHQKLPATVLSRCLQFHLLQMTPEQIAKHLQHILTQEKIPYEEKATQLIAKAATGSMRDALSLLDQCIAYGNRCVNEVDVKSMLGTIEPQHLYEILLALAQQDGNQLLASSAQLAQQGVDFKRALADLLASLHQIAIKQMVPSAEVELHENMQQVVTQLSPEQVQLYYQIGLMGQRDLPFAPSTRTGFEMTLLRMLAFDPVTDATTATISSGKQNKAPTNTINTAPTASTTNSSTQSWQQLITAIDLTGLSLSLAQNCCLIEKTQDTFHLQLDTKHKALLNPRLIERISEQLSTHLGKKMLVKIAVSPVTILNTPANANKQQTAKKQNNAEKNIQQDQQVQRIINLFDATIVKGSVQVKTDKNT